MGRYWEVGSHSPTLVASHIAEFLLDFRLNDGLGKMNRADNQPMSVRGRTYGNPLYA